MLSGCTIVYSSDSQRYRFWSEI